MKGRETINSSAELIAKASTMDEMTIVTMNAHLELLELHARALPATVSA